MTRQSGFQVALSNGRKTRRRLDWFDHLENKESEAVSGTEGSAAIW